MRRNISSGKYKLTEEELAQYRQYMINATSNNLAKIVAPSITTFPRQNPIPNLRAASQKTTTSK